MFKIDLFLKCISLCSSVIVEKNQENGHVEYHASSIDEKALLNGARYLGYIFLGKDLKGNLIRFTLVRFLASKGLKKSD